MGGYKCYDPSPQQNEPGRTFLDGQELVYRKQTHTDTLISWSVRNGVNSDAATEDSDEYRAGSAFLEISSLGKQGTICLQALARGIVHEGGYESLYAVAIGGALSGTWSVDVCMKQREGGRYKVSFWRKERFG